MVFKSIYSPTYLWHIYLHSTSADSLNLFPRLFLGTHTWHRGCRTAQRLTSEHTHHVTFPLLARISSYHSVSALFCSQCSTFLCPLNPHTIPFIRKERPPYSVAETGCSVCIYHSVLTPLPPIYTVSNLMPLKAAICHCKQHGAKAVFHLRDLKIEFLDPQTTEF